MSDIRFNQWLHQSGTGGVSQSDGGHVGIGTTNPLIPVGAGNTHILNVGVVTCNNISAGSSITATTFFGSGANLTGITQTTINNRADNRVLTATGSANVLNAESNVHIDGSGRLMIGTTTEGYSGADDLTISTSGDTGMTIRSGTSNQGTIAFSDATSGADEYRGYVQYLHNGDALLFGTGSTEKLRIDNYGVLRVGNTHSQQTSGNIKRIALGAKGNIWGWASGQVDGALQLAHNYYWTGTNNVAIESDYCSYMSLRQGSLRFGTTASSQTGGQNVSGGINEKVRFENDGDVAIYDGNLSFASGHGIDFSSQSTSQQTNSPTVDDEVLQFYEKGKWTPDVRKNNVSNPAASPLHGRYVRIGQMVWLSMYARWASGSNAQGTNGGWQIYGLPFSLQDDNPGTCRIYQFAPAGYFYINGTYYGSARTIRWQCNNSNRLDLYTDLSSSQLAWNSGAMGITFTGCFMIHE